MNGYDGWTNERQTFTDATIPLLADGIKWLGITPDRHWFWNLGMFTDAVSEGQTFSSYNNQFVLRAGWVPLTSDSTGTLLHIAMNFRAGDVNKDTMQLRSRPEAFEAPYFIDTGKFPAQSASTWGPEIYYRPGRVLIGTEFYWQKITSAETGNPLVHGGDFVVAWLTTGETRSYNEVGGYFRGVSPKKNGDRGRARRVGVPSQGVVQRADEQGARRRNLLAHHVHDQLVSHRQRAARVCPWNGKAQTVWAHGHHPVLSGPDSDTTLMSINEYECSLSPNSR
jgi:hypothetical protein